LALSLTLGLLGLCFVGWRVGAREHFQPLLKQLRQPAQPSHRTQQKGRAGQAEALAHILNADGTVKRGLTGSFDASGYGMEYMASGAPRFVPTVSGRMIDGIRSSVCLEQLALSMPSLSVVAIFM